VPDLEDSENETSKKNYRRLIREYIMQKRFLSIMEIGGIV